MISQTSNNKLNDVGLMLLRIFLGATMLLQHGIGKWETLFSRNEIKFADPFGIGATPSLVLAVFAEVICAILLILGYLTRGALIPLIITMFVAVFVIHISDDFGKMEKGLLYGVGFLTLFLTGPGKYSVDKFLQFKKNKQFLS